MLTRNSSLSNILRALTWAAPCMLIAGCAFHGDALEGAVFEVQNPEAPPAQWQKVPLADAEVLVVWNGNLIDNPVHPHWVCLRAKLTRTDSAGQFEVPGWWGSPKGKPMELRPPVSYVYKAGFEDIPPEPGIDRAWAAAPGVHMLRKSQQPEGPPTRETIFASVKECPLVEGGGAQ